MVVFLQWYKPMESRFANNVETFNECTILVLTYFLFCFTDYVPESEMRSELGEYYNYVNFSNIGVHFFLMISSTIMQMRQACLRRC